MFNIIKQSDGAPDVPDRKIGRPSRIEWPFSKMEVGDCVKITDAKIAPKAQAYAHVYARQHGWKMATKTIDGVLHVWRAE